MSLADDCFLVEAGNDDGQESACGQLTHGRVEGGTLSIVGNLHCAGSGGAGDGKPAAAAGSVSLQ